MTNNRRHEFATKPLLVRQALEFHRTWLEAKLGVPFSDIVIFETDLDLTEIGTEQILGCSSARQSTSRTTRRLRPLLISAEVPADFPPLVKVSKMVSIVDLQTMLQGSPLAQHSSTAWLDCPVALHLRAIECVVIAINVSYHSGGASDCESKARLLVTRRDSAAQVIRLIDDLDRRDRQPRLHVLGGSTRRIVSCDWNELVLDQHVLSLLKDDFESFFERQTWFRENRLPFRRGYLLYGPPGNGKSTAIRAMMTSRGLTAYTLRLFDSNTDDSSLDALFDRALRERPTMILLEDLDRAFPKTGLTKSRVSLQQLLNCLDGVGTGEGIIVVATANEPTLLDSAILRRPGRFDRVIRFEDPDFELRKAYFRRMNPVFQTISLDQVGFESDGFSFAQLREAYITAGHRAFERKEEIKEEDLVSGIQSLRQSMLTSAKRNNSAGFRAAPQVEVTA
jgi:hypothetical protein